MPDNDGNVAVPRPPTSLERALRYDRWIIAAGLGFVTLLCWVWLVPMAHDMYGAMDGPSAWMMTTRWDARHVLLLWTMWAVMMAAMMLPSAPRCHCLPRDGVRVRVVRSAWPSSTDSPASAAAGR